MKTTLHVTDLEQWRWYNLMEAKTKEDLVGSLLRTEPPNDKMMMGTAWHSILENPPDVIDEVEKDGFVFKVECDGEIFLPQVREIRATKDYVVDDCVVTLTGGCDGITAYEVGDHKLTFRPNPENYLESYQWRAYLDIYDADVFKYFIYHGVQKGKTVSIKDFSTMKMYRYPNMFEDIMVGVRGLLGFVNDHVPELIKR